MISYFNPLMTKACYHCGKGLLFGRSHTHHRGVAGGRWKKRAPKTQRIFAPNLQKMEIIERGEAKTVRLCTKCIKRVRKDIADGVRPFLTIAKYQTKPEAQPAVAAA
jgi:ribosomal protein L28